MGTHKHSAVELSPKCEHATPFSVSWLQCGRPRLSDQHPSGRNAASDSPAFPHCTTPSTRLRDALNKYSPPETASGKSSCIEFETTAQASFTVALHSRRDPISLRQVISFVRSSNSFTSRSSDSACCRCASVALTWSEISW